MAAPDRRRPHLQCNPALEEDRYARTIQQTVTGGDAEKGGRGFEVALLGASQLIQFEEEHGRHMLGSPVRAVLAELRHDWSAFELAFVPASSIDPIRIGDSYYLAADGQVAAKPYKLLREALNRSERVAIAKFAWHNRERLGVLQVLDGEVIALHAMRWPDEIRDPAAVAPPATDVDDTEVDGAVALIDAMTTDDLSDFHDEYRTALEELIQAKAEHREPQPVGEAPEPEGKVVDLMFLGFGIS
ncbi:Ku protein [Streptomyces lavendofoliae]|uniref:Ku protein n=1 Tax=Streptomyces lavendofoliae TaxID=67314 RepID=UPI003D9359EA